MYIKEKTKKVREELKKLGYNSRSISVRCRHYSSIYITIKDMTICKDKIENIARKYEKIQRDYATGEILSGGNHFVFVEYDYGIRDNLIEQHIKDLESYFDTLENREVGEYKGFRVFKTVDNFNNIYDEVGYSFKDDKVHLTTLSNLSFLIGQNELRKKKTSDQKEQLLESVSKNCLKTDNLSVEIKENKQKSGIELYFNQKPSEDIRNELKSNGFRWHRVKKMWFTKMSDEKKQFVENLFS